MRLIFSFLFMFSLVLAQEAPPQEARDERVQVHLKNGHSMIGIAKAGVRCERLVRGNFKPCNDPTDRASGVRVWYYQDLDGYIFLESRALERVDVLGKLTPEESRALTEAVAAAHGFKVHALPSARPAAGKAGQADSRPAEPPSDPDGLSALEKSLLERFPPDKGWSPEKFGEIQRRKIVLHVNPSRDEQAFVDQFPVFQTAWKKWLATQPTAEPAPSNGEQPAPSKNDKKK